MNEYVAIQIQVLEAVKTLNDAQKTEIMSAIIDYSIDNKEPEFSDTIMKFAWVFIKNGISVVKKKIELNDKTLKGEDREQRILENKLLTIEIHKRREQGEEDKQIADALGIKESRVRNTNCYKVCNALRDTGRCNESTSSLDENYCGVWERGCRFIHYGEMRYKGAYEKNTGSWADVFKGMGEEKDKKQDERS